LHPAIDNAGGSWLTEDCVRYWAQANASDYVSHCRHGAELGNRLTIRVNAIGPGYMTASMKGIESIYDAPEVKAKILPRIPAGRYGALRELLGATVYFLSDEAGYTTGQYLAIDGGYSLI
jgi:NAD(P)-dependent dehydrogenase (short-subunit alcohol dehydrogenase family)